MFEYNQRVKREGSDEVLRVVAPIKGDADVVAVWADLNCDTIELVPVAEVTAVDEKISELPSAHIVFDIIPLDEEQLQVIRRVDAVGADPILGAYSNMRAFVAEVTQMHISTVDVLADEMNGTV